MKKAAAEQPENTPSQISGITDRSPGDLTPWPGNPRTHSDKQLAKLKASIQKFGFTVAVLIDEAGTILSGHGRVMAAMELGLEAVPVRVISGLTEVKKRAYVIADNKIAMLSKLHVRSRARPGRGHFSLACDHEIVASLRSLHAQVF